MVTDLLTPILEPWISLLAPGKPIEGVSVDEVAISLATQQAPVRKSFVSRCSPKDIVHGWLRKLHITNERSYPSEWGSIFIEQGASIQNPDMKRNLRGVLDDDSLWPSIMGRPP